MQQHEVKGLSTWLRDQLAWVLWGSIVFLIAHYFVSRELRMPMFWTETVVRSLMICLFGFVVFGVGYNVARLFAKAGYPKPRRRATKGNGSTRKTC